ncbi:MAG: (Fe-S)-binding protein [Anaerolineae bacterium]|nr:(Fe-S)-binding protein [Anaerolineae bacterium]MDW8101811.1 (Fe-S)-binding protein [Anaerolineae bacterium]
MNPKKYTREPFARERCNLCGECFHRCPVLSLRPQEAAREMERLLKGKSSRILKVCTSCMACNTFCPQDARPANLILDLWHEIYRERGLPLYARYFLPHSRPNFRTDIVARLPPEERLKLAGWSRTEPIQEFLYSGCNLLMVPYLTFSRLFQGIEIRGGLDYCCGEMLFRMGLYEEVEQVAARLTLWFRRLKAEHVYVLCTACFNMLKNVLPQFGADFSSIHFSHYFEFLLDGLKRENFGPVRPLRLKVTVQDSCHSRLLGEDFAEIPRKILNLLGVEVTEAPHNRESQLCCGIGGGFSPFAAYHPFSILASARATSRDHRRVKAEATCVYCAGCLAMFSVARLADPNLRPVIHLLELVQWAIGEKPSRRQNSLALWLILGTVRHQFPLLLSRKRFHHPPIPEVPGNGGS